MERTGPLRYSYTVILFVLAGLALIAIANHEFLIRTAANKVELVIAVMRCVQVLEAIIFLFAVTVGILRTYRSPLAWPTTAAVSILLAVWVPFGTAAFIYWVGWVRKPERASATGALRDCQESLP
jgi:hypothetical protein